MVEPDICKTQNGSQDEPNESVESLGWKRTILTLRLEAQAAKDPVEMAQSLRYEVPPDGKPSFGTKIN